ncbi:hypothetical protein GCM10008965_34400 [Methylorubrum aminovorans]|nr:hypothetical protein GCM10025880_29530 [Methylorubrum aminovorans]
MWECLLALVQERGVQLGMVFLDGTNMRVIGPQAVVQVLS